MKRNLILIASIALILVSCYPGELDSYDELDIVFTNYDKSFDFASKGTYALPDKIVKITGNLGEDETPEFVKEPYNTQMLQQIEQNMAALGWTKATDAESADLALFPAVWTNTTVVYWYDYWCWYYYYYCGWGYTYPTYTSYTTGTFVMTMVAYGDDYVDPTSVWTAAVNGLVSGSYNASRVTKGIDQAFEQSPYLNIK